MSGGGCSGVGVKSLFALGAMQPRAGPGHFSKFQTSVEQVKKNLNCKKPNYGNFSLEEY